MARKIMLVGLGVAAIVVLAVGFRFYDIEQYPPGLFPDEAANGEDALLVLDGDVRPFYPRGNGREALFFYLEALSIWLFGIGVWQLHIVSAAVGVLTVAATYFASRIWFGRLAGVLSALFMATSYWHVTLSRTGFRAILIPLILALFTAWAGYTIAAVRRSQMGRSYVYAALAGTAFAGGFYTYIAYRVMIGVAGGIFVLLLLAALHPKIGWPHFRRYGRQLVVGLLAAVVVLAPLGWYFVQEPADFVGRAGQVSVFNRELQEEFGGGTLLGTILYSTRVTLLSFFTGDGDLNWRHNVAGFPLLNPLVGVLFLIGLAWSLRGFGWVVYKIVHGEEIHLGMIYAYLLLILAGMLLPVITTAEGMPHGLRSIGLLFPIFLLAGAAGAVAVHWCKKNWPTTMFGSVCMGVIAGGLVLSSLYDGALYFLVARNDAEAYYAYRGDLTEVAAYLRDYVAENGPFDSASIDSGQVAQGKPYLVLDTFSVQTVHFLTNVAAHEYTVGDAPHPDEPLHIWALVDPATSHETVLSPGEIIVFTQSTLVDADRYAATHSNIELLESRRNRFNQEIMRVYTAVDSGAGDVEGTQDAEGSGFDLDA